MDNIVDFIGNYRDYSNTNSKTKKADSNLDKDAFLKLLVTQLKNQDPLSPMEDKEFIAQMAQFSALEQMENLNETVKSSQEVLLDHLAHMNNNMVKSQSSILDTLTEISKSLKNMAPEQSQPIGEPEPDENE